MSNESPEKSLLAAVLLRAVRDYVVYSRAHNAEEERVYEAARKWLFEDGLECDHVASFGNICLVMDLDGRRVRDRIRKMRRGDRDALAGRKAS